MKIDQKNSYSERVWLAKTLNLPLIVPIVICVTWTQTWVWGNKMIRKSTYKILINEMKIDTAIRVMQSNRGISVDSQAAVGLLLYPCSRDYAD